VEDSILFNGVSVESGAEVRRAVLDEGVVVRRGARVGWDEEQDRRSGFVVSGGGVTCVPAGTVMDTVEGAAARR
jgi:ADP-glucose pyrophosphorylase